MNLICKNIKCSIVIINWNTQKLLKACLDAVYSSIDEDTEVIVVDNASCDSSVEFVKNNFPKVQLIVNEENLGFGTANNKAINIAKGEYILFLNTDAIITKDALNKLIDFMDGNPQAGLCTGTLIKANGKIQDTFGPYPSLITELFGRSFLRLFAPYNYTPRTIKKSSPRKVFSIRGACMLAKRSCILSVGGFNEKYFLFLEETDLCLRLNRKGYEIWWMPEVHICHKTGGTARIKTSSARIEYWRSRYIFFHKHCALWKYRILKSGLLCKLVTNWILNLIGSPMQSCRKKLSTYSILILWHILGNPSDWGLNSCNMVQKGEFLIRKGFESWWDNNKEKLLKSKSIIKDNSQRMLVDYEGDFYIKKYNSKRSCLREWRLIQRLRQLGTPTVMPVACGNKHLITQKLQDVYDLHNFVLNNKGNFTLEERINFIRSFAEFINKLHKKGLYHCDLHAGNILIKDPKSISLKFYITDLHRASLKMWLSRKEILNNLVQLNIFFYLQTTSRERLRFLKYYSKDTPLFKRYKHYAKIIEVRTKNALCDLWKKRDKLYLKKNKYGIKNKIKGINCIINPKYEQIDLNEIILHFKSEKTKVTLKNSRSSYLGVLELTQPLYTGAGLKNIGPVVLKIYRQKNFINYFKDIWRDSRAFRSWCGSWALSNRQILSPLPILVLEDRYLRILRKSLIVAKYIDSADNLTVWLKKNWKEKSLRYKKTFINKLAYFTKTIHNRGIAPCDFKGSNILVKEEGGRINLYLIDLDHLKAQRKVGLSKRFYNIAQLDKSCFVSMTMKLRFIESYFSDKNKYELKDILKNYEYKR